MLARARLGEKIAEVALLLRRKATEIEDYVTAPDASADPLSVYENVSRTLTELIPALKLYELPRITLAVVEAQRALEQLEGTKPSSGPRGTSADAS
jgi:hypothetical protein